MYIVLCAYVNHSEVVNKFLTKTKMFFLFVIKRTSLIFPLISLQYRNICIEKKTLNLHTTLMFANCASGSVSCCKINNQPIKKVSFSSSYSQNVMLLLNIWDLQYTCGEMSSRVTVIALRSFKYYY